MTQLAGKIAIVTGAASDIGAATVRILLQAGARVLATDIDLKGAQAVVAGEKAASTDALAHRVDIADEGAIREMAATAVAAFGGVDLLANVAAFTEGSSVNADDDIVKMDTAVWD